MYERVKLKKCGYYFTHRKVSRDNLYCNVEKKCILAYLAVKSNNFHIIAFYHKVNAL